MQLEYRPWPSCGEKTSCPSALASQVTPKGDSREPILFILTRFRKLANIAVLNYGAAAPTTAGRVRFTLKAGLGTDLTQSLSWLGVETDDHFPTGAGSAGTSEAQGADDNPVDLLVGRVGRGIGSGMVKLISVLRITTSVTSSLGLCQTRARPGVLQRQGRHASPPPPPHGGLET
jgi:hypothetical protein